MPTPAIAYLTRTLRAQAGIVISASHNSFKDNGIKFFGGDGTKLPDELELAIEKLLEGNVPVSTVAPEHLGKASRINDAAGRYIEFCKSTIGSSLKLGGIKIVVDCAHGSTYHIAPAVFEELGASVHAIGVSPNGLNINEKSGSTHPGLLVETVLKEKADLGIAFDGDGDRVIMVDHLGNIVDGDEILYVIARDRRRQSIDIGGVVGTQMSNIGLELALEALDIPFALTQVGDRYVMKDMLGKGWKLGGENSGHIICLDIANTGDGIISSLQALAALVNSDQSLSDARAKMRKFPQCMINVKAGNAVDIIENSLIRSVVTEIESKLGRNGRVLLRPSGTEPVIRVMVEGEDGDIVDRMARELSEVVTAQGTSN